jgi:cyclopropane fatty-acyl-phospholipid synthase-like methyltransferase
MPEWFEEFFDGLYARVLANQFDAAKTAEHVRMVKRALRLRRGRRVLDVPCGMGRLALPLARQGLRVTGVDRTAAFLRPARRAARAEGLDVRFVRCDMREIDFDGEFDTAFNWFGSFGYFSDAGNLLFVKRVFRALKPGGRFLVEGINKSYLTSHFRSHGEQTIGGVRIVHVPRWDARTSRVRATWAFERGGLSERRRIAMRIFNGAEMRRLLGAAGFREIELFGYPPFGRFTRHSRRIIAVARRPL